MTQCLSTAAPGRLRHLVFVPASDRGGVRVGAEQFVDLDAADVVVDGHVGRVRSDAALVADRVTGRGVQNQPDVRTRFVLCTEDRFFPPSFMRPVVADRLAITPDEIAAGHCAPLSRPDELAAILLDA